MIPILNPAEIKKIENKINLISKEKKLQKKAVEGVTNILTRLNPSKLIIVVGAGLNGEDGLLIGNKLENEGSINEIEYFHSINSKSKSNNLNLANKLGIDLNEINKYKIINNTDNTIILDCILGISGKLPMRPDISKNLEFINNLSLKLGAKIISLDLPSGFDPNTGLHDKNTLNSSKIFALIFTGIVKSLWNGTYDAAKAKNTFFFHKVW